jgi:hypothetical protein
VATVPEIVRPCDIIGGGSCRLVRCLQIGIGDYGRVTRIESVRFNCAFGGCLLKTFVIVDWSCSWHYRRATEITFESPGRFEEISYFDPGRYSVRAVQCVITGPDSEMRISHNENQSMTVAVRSIAALRSFTSTENERSHFHLCQPV